MGIIGIILMVVGFGIGAYGFILNNDTEAKMERLVGGAKGIESINPAIIIVIGVVVIIVGAILFIYNKKTRK